jgi:polysaccharide export outer membrane protein
LAPVTVANINRAGSRRIQEGKMSNYLLNRVELTAGEEHIRPAAGLGRTALCALAVLAAVAGCQTAPRHAAAPKQPTNAPPQPVAGAPAAVGEESTNASKSMLLQEGDTIKIVFPGAPNLDTIETIRVDGMITLQMVGEYKAAGKTPATVEADLKKLYGSQLVNSDASVTVQSSAFVVYVMGAVMKPGKLISARPLTPLQAVIEAGVDTSRSDLKSVKVIRTDSAGVTTTTKLNLSKGLHGGQLPDFTLKPYDVINVPLRFSWY